MKNIEQLQESLKEGSKVYLTAFIDFFKEFKANYSGAELSDERFFAVGLDAFIKLESLRFSNLKILQEIEANEEALNKLRAETENIKENTKLIASQVPKAVKEIAVLEAQKEKLTQEIRLVKAQKFDTNINSALKTKSADDNLIINAINTYAQLVSVVGSAQNTQAITTHTANIVNAIRLVVPKLDTANAEFKREFEDKFKDLIQQEITS